MEVSRHSRPGGQGIVILRGQAQTYTARVLLVDSVVLGSVTTTNNCHLQWPCPQSVSRNIPTTALFRCIMVHWCLPRSNCADPHARHTAQHFSVKRGDVTIASGSQYTEKKTTCGPCPPLADRLCTCIDKTSIDGYKSCRLLCCTKSCYR